MNYLKHKVGQPADPLRVSRERGSSSSGGLREVGEAEVARIKELEEENRDLGQ
jgi:hypothetical protein